MISIAVPTFNSLEYLKIFYASLKQNTKIPHELIVHDNASTDGTETWLKNQKINYTRSETNEGFCGVNYALKRCKHPYLMTFNSDMYCLPGWDFAILQQLTQFKKNKIEKFTISCCLIEPTHNPEYDYFNAGIDAASFNEKQLLDWYSASKPQKKNTNQYSHPILATKQMMEEIGYFDPQYWPGWGSDHDLPKSFYEKGCRNFIMLGNSRIYHFSSKTFKKLKPSDNAKDGQDIFRKKWNMSVDDFRKSLKIAEPYQEIK